MKKTMYCLTAVSAAVTIAAVLAHLDSLAITAGTMFFHFAMRLLVGAVVGIWLRSHIDSSAGHFRVSENEIRIYKWLKVRKWKKHIPTYNPGEFSAEKHSWEEILHTTCVSEVVHETIMVCSFLPLLAAIPFGSFSVFLITSVFSAGIDSVFVILQRYNRPRILRMLKKQQCVSL